MLRKMVITDLDGTLIGPDNKISRTDLETLAALRAEGIICAAATGRSLHYVNKVVTNDIPLDYCIFSTGGGIIDWPTKEILVSHRLNSSEIYESFQVLSEYKLDFMIHNPIPDNHYFHYFKNSVNNKDFDTRVHRNSEFKKELDAGNIPKNAAQLIAIHSSPGSREIYYEIKKQLPRLNVIMTTSPLDGFSIWIEIFPKAVSKSCAAMWLAKKCNVSEDNIMAVGNDYNDEDLLVWAKKSFVVDNAPLDLKEKFNVVKGFDDSGFSDAVNKWKKGQ
ncbi:MAG: HAD family hydrolase [Elusimicrobiota bacterium]